MFQNKKNFIVHFVVLFLLLLLVNVNIAGAGLIAEWHFDQGEGSESIDSSGNNNNGMIYEAIWTEGIMGSALLFDGINDYVEVTDSDSLDITDEITIEAWVKKQEISRTGSILSKGAYSLKIGADEKAYFELCDGTESMVNVGQLGSNNHVFSLTLYDGKLYGGTKGSGKVYRYDGGTTWTEVGRLGNSSCVYSLIVYDGKLYGATRELCKVYRYDGGTTWTDVGQLDNGTFVEVFSLAVYNDKLYGGTYNSGKVYRYDGGTTWTDVGQLGSSFAVAALTVYNGKLYGGTWLSGKVYRYDGGTTWTDVGQLGSEIYVYSLTVYNGRLYGGTGASCSVYRYDDGTTWTEIGRLEATGNVGSLIVYNNKLYGGTGFSDKIYRYDGETTWIAIGQLEDITYMLSLVVYDGKLYAGTNGKVYSLGDGVAVYSNNNIADEFTFITGTYDGTTAKLFINGELENSINKIMAVDTNSMNLFIGNSYGSSQGGYSSSGEENLKGIIDRVCLYNEALTLEEIMRHYYASKGGFISGKVTNLSEAPMVGAVVSTGRYSDITDISGNYIISVPTGTYVLVASKIWYEQKTEENVKVELGETTIVDFQLKGNLNKTFVYPNPYFGGKGYSEKISFANLPKKATIRIYTLSGKLIKAIKHKDTAEGGSTEWDISGMSSGIYLYTIISSEGTKRGKVSIIK